MHNYRDLHKSLRGLGIFVDLILSYSEMRDIANDFLKGRDGYRIPFLLVIGPPGIGKSSMFEKALDACYIKGVASPFGLYVEAYKSRDKAVILDDADTLLANKESIPLLKALAEDRAPKKKTVTWMKKLNLEEGIPQSFETSSPLCVLLNICPGLKDKNVSAVLDRAKVVIFDPPAPELHQYVKTWWKGDNDVYEFIGSNIRKIMRPSIRLYTGVLREKRLKNDWRKWFIAHISNEEDKLLQTLAEIRASGASTDQMIKTWKSKTGRSRADFFNKSKEMGV